MAKDLVSSLGTAELNALTAVHVVKLCDAAKRMEGCSLAMVVSILAAHIPSSSHLSLSSHMTSA